MLRLSQRSLRISAALCVASALASTPRRCIAEDALRLDRSGCASAWADGIERAVAIELGAGAQDRPEGALEITVGCQGDAVEIEARERGKESTRRRMDLSATAESVRSRVVALAIAGLVRELAVIARGTAQAAPVRAADPTAPPPASTSPDTLEPEHDSSSPPVVQLDVFLAAGSFTAAPGLLWGGGVRARALRLAPLYLALDGQAGTYARDSELGSARLVAGSAGARVGWTYTWSSGVLGAGAGQRLGVARASASARGGGTTDGSVNGLWAAPFAFAMTDTALVGHVRLGIDAELGIVALPVRGRIQEGGDVAAAGAWLALSATLGLRL